MKLLMRHQETRTKGVHKLVLFAEVGGFSRDVTSFFFKDFPGEVVKKAELVREWASQHNVEIVNLEYFLL